jgi:hypothetical protein
MKSHRGDRCLELASETPGEEKRPEATANYVLRRGLGCWELIFAGERAVLKDQLGLRYAAWLLRNPYTEPIHGVTLLMASGHNLTGTEPVLVEGSLGREDLRQWREWRSRQKALERFLEDPDQPQPLKAEAERELEEVTVLLERGTRPSEDAAQRTSRSVRRALARLVHYLEQAQNSAGEPHEVLRGFGRHLGRYLLEPSTQYRSFRARDARTSLAGKFCYEPPAGVVWGD